MGSMRILCTAAMVFCSTSAWAGVTPMPAEGRSPARVAATEDAGGPSDAVVLPAIPKHLDIEPSLKTTPVRISLVSAERSSTRQAGVRAIGQAYPPATVPLPPAAPAGLMLLGVLAIASHARRFRRWFA